MTSSYYHYNTPFGAVTIQSSDDKISALLFGKVDMRGEFRATALTNMAANQLLEYLSGKRREFDLPLLIEGTKFQRDVYEALLCVPYGGTTTYAELAAAAGSPRASRAVGTVMHNNKLAILVPCHRVVAANGLGGYAYGPRTKQFLLDLEKRHS